MSQFADEREAPELWRAFRRRPARRLDEEPLIAEVVRRQGPVVIDDASRSELVDPVRVRTFGQRNLLVVPLVRQGVVIGTLHTVNSRDARPITQEQVGLAMTIASQVALAIDNARLYREVERKLRAAEGLLAVAKALGATLDVQEVARQAARELTRLVGADTSVFFDYDQATRQWRAVAGYHVPEPLRDPSYGIAMVDAPPFVIEGVTSGRPVASADVGSDLRLDHQAIRAMPLQPKSLLLTPVVSRDQPLGGVLSYWWHERHDFTEEELTLAATVASQLAVALDNARLYAEVRRALADLTEAQERLVRGETLRALGELASGAAHHLNNLLAVVVGRVQILQRKVDSEPLRRALAIVERAALDGAEVVRRIQTFARARLGEELAPVDLNRIVADVVEMARGRWQDAMIARGLQLDVIPELADIPRVRGNEAELREVVTNLLINAIEACPAGGRISLATRTDERGVVLGVADTGVGMPEDVLRKALEPFFTTKGVKSTGLGLSVTHGIVRRLGGELEIDSRPGEGTTVTIRLPIGPEAADEAPSPALPSPPGVLRVLVVDDEPEVREVVADLLAVDGHLAWQAAGGADALAMLESGAVPDLVLTDLGMPAMTGWEVAAAIKARWPTVRVGLMTGWGNDVQAAAEARAAVEFILSKPVTYDALRAALAAR
jgi:signal transduction histidine kinase